MTIPVLIILGALWAAVLVPPLLRARSDRHSGAVGDYTNTLGVLRNSNRAVTARMRPAAGLVDGAMHSQTMSRTSAIKKRRRDVFTAMLVSAGMTFLLAAFLGNTVLWVIHIICDLVLGAYIYLLIQIKEQQEMRRKQSMQHDD